TDYAKIGEFKKINFFVGANNSGKSRFLRSLIKIDENRIYISKDSESLFDKFKKITDNIDLYQQIIDGIEQTPINNIHSSLNLKNPYFELVNNYDNFKKLFLDTRSLISNIDLQLKTETNPYIARKLQKKLEYFNYAIDIDDEVTYIKKNNVNHRIYIPILRTTLTNEY